MLKFRLPWDNNKTLYLNDNQTLYLNGDIYLAVLGPQSTTECRLIISKPKIHNLYKLYDNRKNEKQLFYFNNVTCHSRYCYDVTSESAEHERLDHCYDCRAEIEILHRNRTEISPKPFSVLTMNQEITKMCQEIWRALGRNRTLASPKPDSVGRRDSVKDRQWRDGIPSYECEPSSELAHCCDGSFWVKKTRM